MSAMTHEQLLKETLELLSHIIETCTALHISLPCHAYTDSLGDVTYSETYRLTLLSRARALVHKAGMVV